MKLVTVLEMLKAQYLEVNDSLRGAILTVAEFDVLKRDLRNAIDTVTQRHTVNRHGRAAMRSKVGELNRYPFLDVLQRLCRHLDMTLSEVELKQITRIRNGLIHEGRFDPIPVPDGPSLEPVDAWRLLVSFVDRAMLRLVGYRGPYYDCRSTSMQEL